MINAFWRNWKNKSSIEKKAILSINRVINFLLAHVPKDELISIYIKGSFITREMNENSDVDVVPILKDNDTLRKLKIVRDENKEMLRPSEILPISLTELKKNKNSKLHGKLKGRPDTFLRDLEHFKLIYGKKISKTDYPMRTLNKMFYNALTGIKNNTIPLYKKEKFGFSQLIKQIFWIAHFEQKMLGKNPPRTWKGLNKFIKDKEHIIHKAYYFRMHPTKNKKIRKKFINSSMKYVDSLLREYN